jgi:hypothetical protein
MKAHNCRPDSVVYNTIIGSLWATGLVWAQAKATQIFHAACRQGHFRLTVHTLEAGATAAAAAAGPAPAVGSPSALAALAAAATPAVAGASAFAGVGSASGSNSGPTSGAGSRSASPAISLPQAIALKGTSSGQLTSGMVTPSDLMSPGTCGTPLSALAAACAASMSPGSSPLDEGSLAAAAAAAVIQAGATGTGAGTVIEFGMHAFTVGSAVLSLLRWVAELRERLPREPNKDLNQQVCLVLNKGKPSREHTYPAIRAALLSLLSAWGSPFTLTDVPQGCRIQATACDITAWLHQPEADRALAAFNARAAGSEPGGRPLAKELFFQEDIQAEARCAEAYSAVRAFESRCCVADTSLPASFVSARADWVSTAATFAAAFRLKDESLHDGVLLLDRAVAAGGEQLLGLNAAALIVGCLLIASRQAGEAPERLPQPAQLEAATGLSSVAVEAAQAAVRTVLQGDTSAISGEGCRCCCCNRGLHW